MILVIKVDIEARRSGLGNYEQLTKPLRSSYQNSLAFRRTFEGLDNHKLDIIVKKLNGYWGQLLFDTS